MKLDLTVLSGVSAGDVFHFEIETTKPITIGRAQESDLVLQDSSVSRKHAEIRLETGALRLIDVGSTHGTLHMGFRLAGGIEGSRELQSGDEFKIGETIFRTTFDASILKTTKRPAPSKNADEATPKSTTVSTASFSKYLPRKKRDRIAALVGILLLLLLALYFFDNSKSALPKQMSEVPLTIPQDKIIGYFKKDKEGDLAHIDKAKFILPVSDLVIEFDYRGEAPIDVLIDDLSIHKLDPSTNAWQHVVIIVRDPHIGRERKLVLDNTGFPAPKPKKMWAVRYIRATPLTLNAGTTLDSSLDETLSLAERLDKTSDSLYTLIRSSRKSVLAAIVERNLDAMVIPLSLEWSLPAADDISQEVRSIITERTSTLSAHSDEMANRHLNALSTLSGKLDVELWRRVKNRWNLVNLAVGAKNYIEAHDQLKAAMSMFPDDVDYRRVITDRMFNDKKIVPKKVRAKPEKFRKKVDAF